MSQGEIIEKVVTYVVTEIVDDASSVGFRQGVVYGIGTLWTALRFLLNRWGIVSSDRFRS